MSIRLLAACSPGEIRVAAADGDQLLDYALWRPGAPDGLGDLYRGRIEAIMPALGGAFVSLGTGSGFLPLRDGDGRPGIGDPLLVRIVRSAQGGKGPRLRRAEDEPADAAGAPCLITHGPDPLTRFAAAHPDAMIVTDDPSLAADLLPGLRDRIRLDREAIGPVLQSSIDALVEPEIALPGGMRASIHPTPALVAIDVDGGAASQGRMLKPVAQLAANRTAIGPLLHQLRLRNLSGAILIDLAGLASRKRAALRPDIEAALARDPLQPRLLGFTGLGLAEILRPRLHPPLHELMSGPYAAALAALRAAAQAVAMPPHRLPRLRAGLGVATALHQDRFACEALARRAGQSISIRTDPTLSDLSWELDHA